MATKAKKVWKKSEYKNKVNRSLYMNKSTWAAAQKGADAENRSVNNFVETAVLEKLERAQPK